jgi:hypothetical protein
MLKMIRVVEIKALLLIYADLSYYTVPILELLFSSSARSIYSPSAYSCTLVIRLSESTFFNYGRSAFNNQLLCLEFKYI